ncbi:Hint domain-containing protein [Rhizobium rhizogenes]|uniref:Hint domain-containing protein n=1 Tax=Rhizobium rhizogenes TaxID=359 RepID=UPI001573E731|nr:Hint domain-containing protein [Rhizobium rhizogenes]NTH23350.1 Hint domain-containing protein [Rhizobium rhizogenes]NTH36372.1 Hint domain-containing protein [Rhizobium rhizogenes]
MTTYTWTNHDLNTIWIDPANWSPNGLPDFGDSIVINNGDIISPPRGHQPDIGSLFLSPTSTLSLYAGLAQTWIKIDGPITGGGGISVSALSHLEAGSGVTSAVGWVWVAGSYQWGGSGSSQVVTLADGAHFNFSTQFGGTIYQQGTGATTIAYNGPGTVSSISVDGQIATFVTTAGDFTLNFAANLNPSTFILDAATGTIVVCFVTGTLIQTTRGDIPVEELRVGDVVITASSQQRPIRWIGSAELDCANARDPSACWPIRIAAGALGPNKPAHDLFVSPAHGIRTTIVTDVLIPASALVNGSTIVQAECERVTYWHVELDEHDILVTNGLPSESYIDHGNRDFFSHTAGRSIRLVRGDGQRCLTYVSEGPLVEAARMQLRALALDMGWTLSDDPFADVHLVAEGQRIDPVIDGWRARFHVPASVSELTLISEWGVPSVIGTSGDGRRLGVCISGMIIEDETTEPRHIDSNDGRLNDGFHYLEGGCRRWTTGRARLPSSLWKDCIGPFSLTIDLGGPAVPRWIPPTSSGEPAIAERSAHAAWDTVSL